MYKLRLRDHKSWAAVALIVSCAGGPSPSAPPAAPGTSAAETAATAKPAAEAATNPEPQVVAEARAASSAGVAAPSAMRSDRPYSTADAFRVERDLKPIGFVEDILLTADGREPRLVVYDTRGALLRSFDTAPLIPQLSIAAQTGIFVFGETERGMDPAIGRLSPDVQIFELFPVDLRFRPTRGIYDEATESLYLNDADSTSLIVLDERNRKKNDFRPYRLSPRGGTVADFAHDPVTSRLYLTHAYNSSLTAVDLFERRVMGGSSNPFGNYSIVIELVHTREPLRSHLVGYDSIEKALILFDTNDCVRTLCLRDRTFVRGAWRPWNRSAWLLAPPGTSHVLLAHPSTRRIQRFTIHWSDVLQEGSLGAEDAFELPYEVDSILTHATRPCIVSTSKGDLVSITCLEQAR